MTARGNTVSSVQTSTGVEVGTSSVEVLKANETRNGTEIVNSSSVAIYLSLGKAAEAKKASSCRLPAARGRAGSVTPNGRGS